jgi:hypothetical protein
MGIPTHPLLAEIVDQIADLDVPDGELAQVLAPKALPSTAPYLMAQYRVPLRTDRHFGSSVIGTGGMGSWRPRSGRAS